MSRNVRRYSQFLRIDSFTCRWNLRFFFFFFLNVQKNSQNKFSLKIVRVVAGFSNPSRILLNLVSVSQKVREM